MITFRSVDIKSLIAYSSIAHMALSIFFFFFLKKIRVIGAFVLLVGHGFIRRGLFFNFKLFYEFSQSRNIFLNVGKKVKKRIFFFFFFFLLCLNSSLPLKLTFFSEIVISRMVFYSMGGLIIFFVLSVFLIGLYNMKIFLSVFHGRFSLSIKKYKNLSVKTKNFIVIFLHILMAFFFIFFLKNKI